MGCGRADTISTARQREINCSLGTNPGGFQQALFDRPSLELLHVVVDLHEILVCCGNGNENFFHIADVLSFFFL